MPTIDLDKVLIDFPKQKNDAYKCLLSIWKNS